MRATLLFGGVLGLVLAPVDPVVRAQPPAARVSNAGDPSPRAVRVEGLEDPAFDSALRVALGPWGIDVVGPGGRAPTERAVGAIVRARVVAPGRLRIEVQPTPAPDGKDPTLLARELPVDVPLSEPDAASVALTVKTLLRNTDLAPPRERPAPGTGDGAGGDDALPEGDGRGHPSEPSGRASDGDSRGPGPAGTVGSVDASLGPRLGAFSGDAAPLVELRAAVGGSAWLRRWPLASKAYAVVGLGGEVAAGSPLPVEGRGVEGRLHSVELILRADGLLVFPGVGPGATMGVSLGIGSRIGHFRWRTDGEGVGLDGRLVDGRVTRIDPLVVARATPGLMVGDGVLLGLRLGLALPLRRQRYEVRGQPLVEESPVGTEILVSCHAFFPRR